MRVLVLLFVLGGAATCRASATSKPLEVATWAGWPSFPQSLLLETSEFLAEEDATGRLFWGFADSVWASREAREGKFVDAATATGVAFSIASELVAPLTYDVLRLAVQSRAYSPAVEMQRQLCASSHARSECAAISSSWAELSTGEVACDADALTTLVNRAAPIPHDDTALPLFEGDHRFNAVTPANALLAETKPIAVLYGTLGDVRAGELHAVAAHAAQAGALRYVWRHCPSAVSSEGHGNVTWLAGYGVGLDVKSTEYKFLDDEATGPNLHADGAAAAALASRVAAADSTLPASWLPAVDTAGSSTSQDVIMGVDVETLRQHALDASEKEGVAPVSAAAFGKLRAALSDAMQSGSLGARDSSLSPRLPTQPLTEARIEPWEAADLGLQATAWVTAGDDPLSRLETVTSNFPSMASFLATVPVDEGLRIEAAANARLVAPGTSLMSVNGIAVEPSAPTFNFFALLNVLRSEAHVAATFASLPLAPEDRRRIAALAIAGSKESVEAAAAVAAKARNGASSTGSAEGDGDEGSGAAAAEDVAGGRPTSGAGTVRVDVWVEPDVDWVRERVSGSDAAAARVTLANPYTIVSWLNDIEDDSVDAFRRWPSTLRAILAPTWQLHSIKRNLYNTFFVGDLSTPAGMRALATVAYFVAMRIPVRFGVLPLPSASSGSQWSEFLDGSGAAASPLPLNRSSTFDGLHLALLHASVATTHGAAAAADFLGRLSNAWRADHEARTREAIIASGGDPDAPRGPGSPPPPPVAEVGVSVEAAISAYAGAVAAATGAWGEEDAAGEAEAALADADGALRRLVRVGADWVAARGLPHPCIVLNGRVIPGLDVQAGGFMPMIGDEMGTIQRAVGSGALDDAVAPSVYAALLGRASALNTKHAHAAARVAAEGDASTRAVLRALPGTGLIAPVYQPAVFAAEDAQRFFALSAPEAAPLRAAATYVSAPGTADDVKPVSLTLVDDFGTAEGLSALAAAVSFIRGGGSGGADTNLPSLAAPAHLLPGIAAAVRVAPLHVPALHTGGAQTASSTSAGEGGHVGRFVSAVWAVASGACRTDSATRSAPLANFNIRLDDSGPLLGDVVDAVWSVVVRGGATVRMAAAATRAALDARSVSAAGTALGRSAAKLSAVVDAIAAGVDAETGSVEAACLSQALLRTDAVADVARHLISAAVPEARVTAASGGGVRVRAIAANGRLLALGDPRGGQCVIVGADSTGVRLANAIANDSAAHGANAAAPPPSLAALPACISPSDVAILVMSERTARGAPVAALLSSVTAYPNVDPDDATAEWVSGVVAQAAAAVGASLHVKSGNLGGRAIGRMALRTQLLAGSFTSFESSAAAAAAAAHVDDVGGTDSEGEGATSGGALLHVTAIVDPLSEDATRIAPLLRLLRDRLGATVSVHLVPPPRAPPQPPLRSFYRFVMPADFKPTATGAQVPLPPSASAWERPVAAFAWLPPSSILTMKHYVPEAWNTQAASADVDLDNLRLADVPSSTGAVQVSYALRDILVAGQCLDVTAGGGAGAAFPNGLQLQLAPASTASSAATATAAQSDTLVMQNLGYWQLKAATPGVFNVRLAAGRGAALYDIVVPAAQANATSWAAIASSTSSGGGGAGGGGGYAHPMMGRRGAADGSSILVRTAAVPVVVRDFTGPITQLTVRKQAGREAVPLLAPIGSGVADADIEGSVEVTAEGPAAAAGGLLSGISRRLFGGGAAEHAAARTHPKAGAPASVNVSVADGGRGDADVDARPPLHVFSLASGHLYERFLKIMMLSAVKRTPGHRLTFWLLENTLSPAFKRAVPALTSRHAFDVRYVTYKWPNWLRQQSEKQRIIWGYKILFLDVLFPLNVTKVIYVDSDQVVRADLAELWNMDLQGAPYAYTPFCDSRKETLGYQFWRSGYWADHLQGKPYHISALYVVDLEAFRRAAVGDTLRSVYDTLSRDPGSLSNLDQDLPNYAQSLVPIHSLPQDWLWCESWCSDDSKAEAKTIDLCNNPRFKEPKLDMARRVISGPLFPESWVQLDEEVKADEAAYRQQLA